MSKTLAYFFRAMAITSIITQKLPEYLEDNKLTVEEMAEFMMLVCNACGWKASIDTSGVDIGQEVNFRIED